MKLTHIDINNNPTMVDISDKKETIREAIASVTIKYPEELIPYFNNQEIHSKKGPVIATAIIAGTMAAKNTSQLIPMCHPIPIKTINFDIDFKLNKKMIIVHCLVKTQGQTGVEMEALTGASVFALTLYDMCKAITHELSIDHLHLVKKTGGKRNIQDGKLCD